MMTTILTFTVILLVGAYCAGLLGSLTGLGGGVVVIPLLTLCFDVDFHYAIGAALVASIATSSGSGSAYVKEGITNNSHHHRRRNRRICRAPLAAY